MTAAVTTNLASFFFLCVMLAFLLTCSDSLRVSQNEVTEMKTYQSLLQIYEKAFVEESSQVQEAETYIKHYENKYHSYIMDNVPVIILTHRLLPSIGYGNNLCRWLNILACADTAGFHVITINLNHREHQQLPVETRFSYPSKPTAFELALPSIIMHPNPSPSPGNDRIQAVEFMKQCVRMSSSWESYFPGGMYDQYQLLGSIGATACDAYLHDRFGQNNSAYVLRHDEFDEIHLPVNQTTTTATTTTSTHSHTYPLFPDALILLRCADVLTWTGGYGFVNFHVYKRLIPATARSIYINSEPLVYNPMHHSQTSERQDLCRELAGELIAFLRVHFPTALITVRRGNAHLSMVQIARTAVVISAPSTFTLLPGLANTHAHHNIYMLRTNLFANNIPDKDLSLSPQFHWINSPKEIVFPNRQNLRDRDAVRRFFQVLTDPNFELIYSNSTN